MPDANKMAQVASDYILNTQGVYISPQLLKAQMQHETDNFSSELAAYHNYAGIKSSTPTGLTSPEQNDYKAYASDEEFAEDWAHNLALYAKYYKDNRGVDHIEDVSTFVDMLEADPDYQYFTGDKQQYANGLATWIGVDAPDIDSLMVQQRGPWGVTGPVRLTNDAFPKPDKSTWEEFKDKFLAAEVDNGITAAVRTAWIDFSTADALSDMPLLNTYKPSQDDVALVQKTLTGNPIAQQYVLTNASSQKALMELLATKQADIQREKEIEDSDFGISTLGTIAGSVLDPVMLLSLVSGGFGAGAKAVQLASKIGKARALMTLGDRAVNSSRLAKFAANALTTSVAVGADRFVAQKYGGFTPNYGAAMTLGAIAGGLGALIARHPNTPMARDLEKVYNLATDNAAAAATGAVSPMEAKPNLQAQLANTMQEAFSIPVAQEGTEVKAALEATKTIVPKHSATRQEWGDNATWLLPDIAPSVPSNPMKNELVRVQNANNNYTSLIATNSLPDKLVKSGNLFIIPEEAARRVASNFGITLDKDAKAFSIPHLGISVILKEKATRQNIMGLVMHEVGVHRALKDFLPEKDYNILMSIVEKRMKTSKDKRWIEATKYADSPEEALAYWVEARGDKPDALIKQAFRKFEGAFNGRKVTDDDIQRTIINAMADYVGKKGSNKALSFIVKNMQGTASKGWKAAMQATSGKSITATFRYWLTHNPNVNSKLFKELRWEALEDLGVQGLTDKQVIDWALKNYMQPVMWAEGKIYKAVGATADSPLMRVDAFDVCIPKSTVDTLFADNAQFIQTFKRNAQETVQDKAPVQKLADGGAIVGGIHYSKNNVFSTVFDAVSDSGKGSEARQGFWGGLGRAMEHSRFLGNIYGVMVNSHSPAMQKLANILFDDPRMNAAARTTMSTEGIKRFLTDRFMGQYMQFVDARTKYINDTFGIFNILQRNRLIKTVDKYVIDCHDAMMRGDKATVDKYDAGIKAMATQIAGIRADMLKQFRKRSEALGGKEGLGSLIEEDWEPISNGFYRVTDIEKRANFTRYFKDKDAQIDFLKKYARTFMDEDAERKFYTDKKYKEWQREVAAWEKQKNSAAPKPEWHTPTEEELQKFYDKEASDWAYGMTDRNASKLTFDKPGVGTAIDAFKHRVAIDTSGEMKLPNGANFSFDNDLRNYDMDSYVPQIINRMTGEAAMHATLGDAQTVEAVLNKVTQEIGGASLVRDGDRELEAMRMGVDRILGRGSYNTIDQKLGDVTSNMLRSYSYAINGGNMTFAQLGEVGGMMAYGGWKALTGAIPGLGRILRGQRLGGEGADILESVQRKLYAQDAMNKGWGLSSSTDSRVYSELLDKVSESDPRPGIGGRTLDMMNKAAKRAALLTSTINMLPKLTEKMVGSMRASAIEDTMEWALKGKVGWMGRNPFSEKKLAAAGVYGKDNVAKIRADIKKYLIDGKGDVDKWMDESQDTFFAWRRLVDNESYRGIQQLSIGNSSPFKEKHRLLMQFKDFTLRAVNSQFMRAITNHELDDGLAFLYSYATNAGTYWLLTQARAWAYYRNDPEKKQKFLEEQANWKKVAMMGFLRASFTAPASFISDGVEAATGYSMGRTTVDNSKTYFERQQTADAWGTPSKMTQDSWYRRAGQVANQAPAIGMFGKMAMAANGVGRLVSGNGDQRDIDSVIKALPLGSWFAMSAFGNYIKEESDRPEKEVKEKKRMSVSNVMQTQRKEKQKQSIDALLKVK